jgi:hypothetical protein
MTIIPKQEASLKSLFAKELKHQLPGFYILQYATNGAPDREIVGAGITTRWEMKHGTPAFDSPSDQELMCARLAHAAHCRYIVWHSHRGIEKTMIVHPRKVMDRASWDLEAEAWCVGFDMKWLVEQVRKAHGI